MLRITYGTKRLNAFWAYTRPVKYFRHAAKSCYSVCWTRFI